MKVTNKGHGSPKHIKTISSPREFQARCAEIRASGGSLGFVPTMGALHAGHRSLIERSVSENAVTAISIFVNPTQFDDPKDLIAYPEPLEADLAMAEAAGADIAFLPTPDVVYPHGYRYRITESKLSKVLCGAHRPGHFDGVLTVVMKLLNLAGADNAYFGEKDYQQFLLVRDMAEDFFLRTRIVPCPIVRESDGLAMSSRNVRLDPESRRLAPEIFRIMQSCADPHAAAEKLTALGFELEYLEDRPELGGRRFAAVRIGGVRLIDNISLQEVRS